jgi:hypothetical protein
MPLFDLKDLLKVTVSPSNSKDRCMFCRKTIASKRIKTWLRDLPIDTYLACENCSTGAILPAFAVQGAKISWDTETEAHKK